MNSIAILPPHEAQKIAAGEVVERPSHIVKELLENALDAGATRIDISLEQAGKKLIKIIDNGCGMSPDDARLCFFKHATSKIQAMNDLATIKSFGFRGEALASISAVSKTTVKTRSRNQDLGIMITHEQGAITQEETVTCQVGTEFLVRDLFYNMPARKKFLRHDTTEINHVQQLIYALCLSNLGTSVTFSVDNTLQLNAPACKTIEERIVQLWGYNAAQHLTPLISPQHASTHHNWLSLSGTISYSTFWRHSRDRIFFFVNNRWIKDSDVAKALLKGYSNALPPGKFPMACIFITAESSYVDINVHPKKEEVRFLKPGVVATQLQNATQKSLESHVSNKLSTTSEVNKYGHLEQIQASTSTTTKKHLNGQDFFPQTFKPFSYENNSLKDHKRAWPQEHQSLINTPAPTLSQEAVKPLTLSRPAQTQNKIIYHETSQSYSILGQLFKTYIMIEKDNECIMIDQHAAHERILYEQWKEKFSTISGISLLFPSIITLPTHHIELLLQQEELFQKQGITIEQFGKQQLRITTSPPKVNHVDLEDIIKDAGYFLEEHEMLSITELRKKLYEHMHSHMACKAAIKAGDLVTSPMIKQLVDDLLIVDNRFQCIHGRPTMWTISKYEVEKKFRRK